MEERHHDHVPLVHLKHGSGVLAIVVAVNSGRALEAVVGNRDVAISESCRRPRRPRTLR